MNHQEYAAIAQAYQVRGKTAADQVVAAQESLRLRSKRISSINGESYFVAQTFTNGSFGKMRYALDNKGDLLVAKDVRFSTRKEFDSSKVDADGNMRRLRTTFTQKEQWNRELAHLQKANQLTDVATYDERGIAFMPVLEQDLSEVVKHRPPSAEAIEYPAWCLDREAVVNTMVHDIATQLHSMHAGGHLHLDIKPDNIAVDSKGDIKLVDFGLAQEIDKEVSGVRGFRGTPAFMAPEVFAQGFSTARSEMWSLGATAITLLSGTYLMDEAIKAVPRKAESGRTHKSQEVKLLTMGSGFSHAHHLYAKVYNKSIHRGRFSINLFFRDPDSDYFPSIREAYKKVPKQTLWILQTLLAPEPGNRLTPAEATANLSRLTQRAKDREQSRQTLMSNHAPSLDRTITQGWLEAHRSLYHPAR